MEYSEIVQFHGHECPGLAIGYRMAQAGMKALNAIRSADEQIVAIVENDACGVDALQYLTGCTFGKGNLIFHDYGKHVYTLYSRSSRKGIRVVFHGKGVLPGMRDNRAAFTEFILNCPDEELLTVSYVVVSEPEKAQIRKSIFCDACGESVMESRIQDKHGKKLCIPCAEKS